VAASHTRAIGGLATIFSAYTEISLSCAEVPPNQGTSQRKLAICAGFVRAGGENACSATRDMSHVAPAAIGTATAAECKRNCESVCCVAGVLVRCRLHARCLDQPSSCIDKRGYSSVTPPQCSHAQQVELGFSSSCGRASRQLPARWTRQRIPS
jgi:hypothetical protein